MVFLGSTPIGGPIVGWVAETFGARYALGVGAVAAVGAGLWGLRVVRRTAPTEVVADLTRSEVTREPVAA
jgi:hypothetical protein